MHEEQNGDGQQPGAWEAWTPQADQPIVSDLSAASPSETQPPESSCAAGRIGAARPQADQSAEPAQDSEFSRAGPGSARCGAASPGLSVRGAADRGPAHRIPAAGRARSPWARPPCLRPAARLRPARLRPARLRPARLRPARLRTAAGLSDRRRFRSAARGSGPAARIRSATEAARWPDDGCRLHRGRGGRSRHRRPGRRAERLGQPAAVH